MPLENLRGRGGGAGEVKKNIRAIENKMKEKNHVRQLTLKSIHAMP